MNNKSYDLGLPSTGITATAGVSTSNIMENNDNLNFVDNLESSSQMREALALNNSKLQTMSNEPSKPSKPPPSKILPTALPLQSNLDNQDQKNKTNLQLKEKSLMEMGFKSTDIEGWDDLVQPPKENLYKLLKSMIDNHIKPSVQIRIGTVTFNCHMMVLQCYSQFFLGCSNEVLIQLPEEKITPGAFQMVYDWMLAEEPLVQREGIVDLFNAANFLHIDSLINQCWMCLDDDVHFREDTAFLLYLEARNYDMESLEHLMLTRICKFFLTLVASKEFLLLNKREICTLLTSNTIGVNSEIEIFMSVVRWLSYDWEKRQQDVVPVSKCVRFGLMPPWFLVLLNKHTGCEEIDRIICHAEVKKLINDGISFTTTQLYYDKKREEFLQFIERYQLVPPMQRQWVLDRDCAHHHRINCPNMQHFTYKAFLDYLEMIQTIGKDYWSSLEMASELDSHHCCTRGDRRKGSNDLNAGCSDTARQYARPLSRDQGVQVETESMQQHEQQQQSLALAALHRRTQLNQVTCQSGRSLDEVHLARLGPEYVDRAKSETPQTVTGRSSAASTKASTSTSTEYSYNDDDDDDWQVAATAAEKRWQQLPHHAPPPANELTRLGETPKPQGDFVPRQLDLNGDDDQLVPAMGLYDDEPQLPCCAVADLRSIKGPKVLVFGGVDPYCPHCKQETARRGQQYGLNDSSSSRSTENTLSSPLPLSAVNNCGDRVLLYDAATTTWQHISNIPFGSRHHHVAVLCNGLIYVVGGTRTALGCTKNSKCVWSLDPCTLQWCIECTLPESRRDFAVIAIDDKCERCPSAPPTGVGGCGDGRRVDMGGLGTGFFVIGGEGAYGRALDTVWFYDVLRKQWTKKASLNVGRYGFAATLVNNEIWIAGGIINDQISSTTDSSSAADGDGSSSSSVNLHGTMKGSRADIITDTLEYYSLKCASNSDGAGSHLCGYCDTAVEGGGQWIKSKLHLRVPRLFGKFCRLSSHELYLVGGIGFTGDNSYPLLTSLDAVDCFDFSLAKWLRCGSINWARHGHDVAALNKRIVIIGGVSTIEKRTLTEVEQFCTQTGKCVNELPELPWPLSGSSVLVLDDED